MLPVSFIGCLTHSKWDVIRIIIKTTSICWLYHKGLHDDGLLKWSSFWQVVQSLPRTAEALWWSWSWFIPVLIYAMPVLSWIALSLSWGVGPYIDSRMFSSFVSSSRHISRKINEDAVGHDVKCHRKVTEYFCKWEILVCDFKLTFKEIPKAMISLSHYKLLSVGWWSKMSI